MQRFNADGSGTIEYADKTMDIADYDRLPIAIIRGGQIQFGFGNSQGTLTYSAISSEGTEVTMIGDQVTTEPLSDRVPDAAYSCSGDTMRQTGPGFALELERID